MNDSEKSLNILRDALEKEHIGQYCILEKKEWKVCIQQENGKWKVSFIERNNDVSPVFYDDVNDACLDLIRRVTPKNKIQKVINNYQRRINISLEEE